MPAPSTYSTWVAILERFGNGDDTVLDDVNSGHFTLDAGTAQRFCIKVEEVYKKRKQNWLERFQISFQSKNIRTDNDLSIVLRNGKQNLLPLSKFVSSQGLPEDLRKTLREDLESFVGEIKKALKENASKTSIGRDRMLIMLNAFSLPTLQQQEDEKRRDFNNPQKGRNIIF